MLRVEFPVTLLIIELRELVTRLVIQGPAAPHVPADDEAAAVYGS